MARRLSADEEALWAQVTATVAPLPGRSAPGVPRTPRAKVLAAGIVAGESHQFSERKLPPKPASTETLDASWDRRISSGRITPDHVVDLHGLSVEGARRLLHRRVLAAEAMGARVVLVITGKGQMQPPSPADLMPGLGGYEGSRRGAIRAQFARWVAEEGLSGLIAAVRRAHPRHGGAGAAYLILKRRRHD